MLLHLFLNYLFNFRYEPKFPQQAVAQKEPGQAEVVEAELLDTGSSDRQYTFVFLLTLYVFIWDDLEGKMRGN